MSTIAIRAPVNPPSATAGARRIEIPIGCTGRSCGDLPNVAAWL